MKAISIRQPWAWAILFAGKDIENRDWRLGNPGLRFRGRAVVHASTKFDKVDIQVIREIFRETGRNPDDVPYPRKTEACLTHPYHLGMLIGTVEIVDVITATSVINKPSPSPWFFGPCGLVLVNPRPFEKPVHCKGQLGFFDVTAVLASARWSAA
jgi:hypothetical protein